MALSPTGHFHHPPEDTGSAQEELNHLRSQLEQEVERSLHLAQSERARCTTLTVAAQEQKFADRLQALLTQSPTEGESND